MHNRWRGHLEWKKFSSSCANNQRVILVKLNFPSEAALSLLDWPACHASDRGYPWRASDWTQIGYRLAGQAISLQVLVCSLGCNRLNASARRASRECSPRASCRPESHFYRETYLSEARHLQPKPPHIRAFGYMVTGRLFPVSLWCAPSCNN